MFPNANHRELMDFCNEIQSKHRRGLCGKKYMYHEELSELFTEYTGVPIGYQDTFLSGETYTEVYLRSQERLKFLERLNRN